jgi:hypothetical protein
MRETQSLSAILLKIEHHYKRAQALSVSISKADFDRTLKHFKGLELKQSQDALKFYQDILKEYGSTGELTLIQGKVWDVRTDAMVEELRDFKMYLSCSLEEAKEIFKAQVANTAGFLPETISYTTIPLKHLILT